MGSALSVKNYESPADRRLAGGFLADTIYMSSLGTLLAESIDRAPKRAALTGGAMVVEVSSST